MFLSPSCRAFAFIAAVSCDGVSFTARPSAGTARLSDPIIAACSRSRFDSVIPSSSRDFAPPLATSTSFLLMVDSPSSSRPLSITTSIAASFEIDAIGRSLSGLRAKTTCPPSSSTSARRRLDVRLAAPWSRRRAAPGTPPCRVCAFPFFAPALPAALRLAASASPAPASMKASAAKAATALSAIAGGGKSAASPPQSYRGPEDDGKFPNLRLIAITACRVPASI